MGDLEIRHKNGRPNHSYINIIFDITVLNCIINARILRLNDMEDPDILPVRDTF